MQKSWRIVAPLIIVTLLVIWLACSWYTGKKLQTAITDQPPVSQTTLDKLSQQLNTPGRFTTQVNNYQRHWFTSQFDYIFRYQHKPIVAFHVTVLHGPLPFQRLIHGHWRPIAGEAQIHLQQLDNHAFWQQFAIKTPQLAKWINVNIVRDYGAQQHWQLQIQPWSVSLPHQISLQFGELNLRVEQNRQTDDYRYQIKLAEIAAQLAKSPFASLKQLQATSSQLAANGEQGEVQVGELLFHLNGKHQLSLRQIAAQMQLKPTANQHIEQQETGIIQQILYDQQLLGSNRYSFKQSNLSDDFVKRYLLSSSVLFNQQQFIHEWLAQRPIIDFMPIQWQLDQQQSEITLHLQLQPPQANQPISAIDQATLKLAISPLMLKQLLQLIITANNPIATDKQAIGNSLIDNLGAVLQQAKLIQLQNNQWIAEIHYHNQQLTNQAGEPISLTGLEKLLNLY